MKIRVGFGQDTHKLVKGRPMMIGGVDVPYHLGCDGLFRCRCVTTRYLRCYAWAANMRDIGYHFPDKICSIKILIVKFYYKKRSN
jgi:2C-methyl-D-erythritol 2,4-cyclodiphosphate synthase